jgi:serine-type D-Ala-D-Ala carboxypeptidase/endopeptidase
MSVVFIYKRSMKNAFLLLFTLLSCSNAFSQPATDSLAALINKLGNDFIKEKEAVGLSIGLYKNGKTCFYNFGTIQKGKPVAPTQNTVYEIGSITKTFVSRMLAMAVLQHKVNLDDDIRKYLKESYPNLEYKGNPIKLVHLANTTSLLPDWLPDLPPAMKGLPPDPALQVKINYYKSLTKHDFFKALHTVALDTIPGTRRYHSNAGAQLLAYILEDVYQMPMDKAIEKHITGAYKMKSTAFLHAGKTKALATGYTASGREGAYEWVIPYFKYAGSLGSTSNDLIRYIGLLLNNNDSISALSLKKTADIDAASGKLVSLRPDSIAAPDIYSTALNWFKYQPAANQAQIWADGGTNGFNSYLVMYPYTNTGIVLLTNTSSEKIFRALPGLAQQIAKAVEEK